MAESALAGATAGTSAASALEALLHQLHKHRSSGQAHAAAQVLVKIGVVLAELGDAQGAADRLAEALDLEPNDAQLACRAYTALGQAQLARGQREDALASLHRAWRLAESLHSASAHGRSVASGGTTGEAGSDATDLQVQVLLALGGLHQTLGAFPTAQERLQVGLALARMRQDRMACARLLRLLGRNQLLLGQVPAALPLLEEAWHLARDETAVLLEAGVLELLSLAHEQAGDAAQALRHLRRAVMLREQEQHQATLRRVHEITAQQQVHDARQEARTQRTVADELAAALASARQAEAEKARLLEELADQTRALAQLAREDGLTGMANRRWFDDTWARELERARRHHHALSVAMLDVDDFKRINDRFGHAVGDQVLRRVAQTLRDNCRVNDLVARYGGEEFVLMFVETPQAGAEVLCEKLRQRVEGADWRAVHPQLERVTASIGLACWQADHQDGQTLQAADAALYRAKASGKNRVCAAATVASRA
jgi:diguanylate cyclase (GGDEF)-like protein